MEKLTKEKAIKMHREMWNWIANKIKLSGKIVDRLYYFRSVQAIPDDRPDSLCYCCEYAMQQNGGENVGRCKYCPLDWDSKCDEFMCLDVIQGGDYKGLLAQWDTEMIYLDKIERTVQIAEKITNLKEREE
ncbi:MAG: hypothetical protein ACLTBR_03295 [Anaerostipes sp.]|uniref:hypothetical protein n=1 Tax=Anaerostipes sp. TaxID=1872530 RepID=UPI003996B6EC